MTLRGTDDRLHATPMVYSSPENAFYYGAQVRKANLRKGGGGTSVQSTNPDNVSIVQLNISEALLNQGRVIVDVCTTDTYFSRAFGSIFSVTFQELMGEAYAVRTFIQEELAQQPTLLLQFMGIEVLNQTILNEYGTVPGLVGTLYPEHPLDVLLAIPPEHYYEFDLEADGYISRFYVDGSSGAVLGANALIGHDVL